MNNSSETNINFMVCVKCATFNHAPYIEDAMNGFCMQQTTFPFVCTIIDDASTDGELEVIHNYIQEHFDLEDKSVVKTEETEDYIYCYARHKTNRNCFFAVYFLKYNHYSIKKPKAPYIQEWTHKVKHISLCEGDDYWIDPQKLQKQVDFLESHPDCTMTCCRAKLYSDRQQKYVGERFCYNNNQFVISKEIIERGGLYINTCSILYKREVIDNYPDYCLKCAVGDYPLQIMCAMKGRVYYFNDIMCVYRVENPHSWCSQQKINKTNEERMRAISSEVNMLKGFSKDYPKYSNTFLQRSNYFLIQNLPSSGVSHSVKESYFNFFRKELCHLNLFWKFKVFLKYHHILGMESILNRYLRRFDPHKLDY